MKMTDDYFRIAFTYVECDPAKFPSVQKDLVHLLELCVPKRTCFDVLIMDVDLAPELHLKYKSLVKDSGPTLILYP
jgi:hypothetical protein